MIEVVIKFLEKVKQDRHNLMVKKGYIKEAVEYSDDLWNEFRNDWLSKPII